jgi:hypothetical protein
MSAQNMFILTAAQSAVAEGFNNENVAVEPRAVDGANPGAGANLNDAASDYAIGDAVSLTGMFVAPTRIMDDPEYRTYAPGLIAFLRSLPWAALETETIFAPEQ